MTSAVFSDIYRANRWNGVESLSGPGSGTSATRRTMASLVFLVDMLKVRSVLDVGCGDGHWMPELPGYVGIDVVPEPLSRARERHPLRRYVLDDGSPLPSVDLVFTRDVIQHLSMADGVTLLQRIRAADPRWLLASTYMGTVNHDVPTGGYCEPDLMAFPYLLGPPLLLIPDGWGYHDPKVIRDTVKHLGLWDFRS